jgi:hypothetical protein
MSRKAQNEPKSVILPLKKGEECMLIVTWINPLKFDLNSLLFLRARDACQAGRGIVKRI